MHLLLHHLLLHYIYNFYKSTMIYKSMSLGFFFELSRIQTRNTLLAVSMLELYNTRNFPSNLLGRMQY